MTTAPIRTLSTPRETSEATKTPRKIWSTLMLIDEAGSLMAHDLQVLLTAEYRPVRGVRFVASGRPDLVFWSGRIDDAEVGGEIRMRCDLWSRERFTAWAEITVTTGSAERVARRFERLSFTTTGRKLLER